MPTHYRLALHALKILLPLSLAIASSAPRAWVYPPMSSASTWQTYLGPIRANCCNNSAQNSSQRNWREN